MLSQGQYGSSASLPWTSIIWRLRGRFCVKRIWLIGIFINNNISAERLINLADLSALCFPSLARLFKQWLADISNVCFQESVFYTSFTSARNRKSQTLRKYAHVNQTLLSESTYCVLSISKHCVVNVVISSSISSI